MDETESRGRGRRVVHAEVPVQPSPSGLPTRHLVSREVGATSLFVAQQWLQPGQRVPRHVHPVEEVLTFVAGEGEATIGDERYPIAAGVTLYVPAHLPHGFRATGAEPLGVTVIFPGPEFAKTTFVED